MLFYGLQHLKEAGIHDIAVVLGPRSAVEIQNLLGNGTSYGLHVTYVHQEEPRGIAHAIGLCQDFIASSSFVVYLGDNIVFGGISQFVSEFQKSDLDRL
jgi:glucose-1-phosphate thymidylyltransferase